MKGDRGVALPRASSLRLVRPAGARASAPRVPLGVASWTEDGAAIAVVVETSADAMGGVAEVAPQLPSADALEAGTLVVVLAEASPRGVLSRLLRRLSGGGVSRAVRASALVARGYTGVAAAHDPSSGHDLVWGFSPARLSGPSA